MKTTYVNVKCGRFIDLKGLTPKTFIKDTRQNGRVECVRYFKASFWCLLYAWIVYATYHIEFWFKAFLPCNSDNVMNFSQFNCSNRKIPLFMHIMLKLFLNHW